jgi:uncharacterized protein (DUF433 family)
MINFKEYITINPEIRFGKPTIIGTRISVYDVLNWLANGMTIKEIIYDFPELTEEKIKSCILFATKKN